MAVVNLSLILTVILYGPAGCSHFYGATVRFKTDPKVPNKATFYYKIAWRLNRGACNFDCTVNSIGTYGTRRDDYPGDW